MKLEETVTSLEWSRKLKEANFSQDTIYVWIENDIANENYPYIHTSDDAIPPELTCAAYTLPELLKKFNNLDLTIYFCWSMNGKNFLIKESSSHFLVADPNPCSAAAEALLRLKDNGYL